MSREKTNSITHLVKVVAREEIATFTRELRAANSCQCEDLSKQLSAMGIKFLGEIQTSLEKVGEKWTQEEDTLLIYEVRTALAQIAKNHSRSIGAIRARVNQQELI